MPAEPPVVSPASLDEAYAHLADGDPPWRPLAGGTDVMVQINGEIGPPPDRLIDLWRLDELRGLTIEPGFLVLGALTTYTEIRRSKLCRELAPALVDAAATIGAAQIQNRGTLGGNIANASPAGDTLPVLLAMDAEIVLGSRGGERTVRATDFWTAYRTTARRHDELVLRVRLPIVAGRQVRFRKIGTRRAQAISKVVLALAWRPEGPTTEGPTRHDGESGSDGMAAWSDVRLAIGSVAAIPIRARAAEAVLDGAAPTPQTAERVAAAVAGEIEPIDDVRSTAAYRRAVTARVVHRLIRDAGGW